MTSAASSSVQHDAAYPRAAAGSASPTEPAPIAERKEANAAPGPAAEPSPVFQVGRVAAAHLHTGRLSVTAESGTVANPELAGSSEQTSCPTETAAGV